LGAETRVKWVAISDIFTQVVTEMKMDAFLSNARSVVDVRKLQLSVPRVIQSDVGRRHALRSKQNSGQLTLEFEAIVRISTRSNATDVVVSMLSM
jgi:hypothetical protein